ncbi:hypothetical protein glysoja_035360 [Glycine soja]|uniref:Uncharacterized protein n=1 Tax=Glycine soja TaxID=3848 RepID=A0A0B2PMZ1_GLYSO|nr:hypothetical protein glysoja_035360 [Glycine soja]
MPHIFLKNQTLKILGGINSDFEKKIPSRKRSSVVYKPMTPMEKFQKQLLSLYRSERQPEESLLVDNVNNFIPENEIGLGAILLKTDDAASTDPGSANR